MFVCERIIEAVFTINLCSNGSFLVIPAYDCPTDVPVCVQVNVQIEA